MKTSSRLILIMVTGGVLIAPLLHGIEFSASHLSESADDSKSISWADIDQDGWPDLLVTNFAGSNELHRNQEGLALVAAAEGRLVTLSGGHHGASWGDVDNDGDLDVFVCRRDGAPNLLFLNGGNGEFEIALGGDLALDGGDSVGAAWADFNRDGWVDLYVCNLYGIDFFYVNNGDQTFTRLSDEVLALENSTSLGCAWGDPDGDGDADLFVAKGGGANRLFLNQGDGHFVKRTSGPVAEDTASSVTGLWGDFDNDGHADLYVINRGQPNFLYRNTGDGSFERILSGGPVALAATSNAGLWADVDNDGDLDLYVTNWDGERNELYLGDGAGQFAPDIGSVLAEDYSNSTSVAAADFNGDGALDIAVANDGPNVLFQGVPGGNNWLRVRCVGTLSNRAGLGAKVFIRTDEAGRTRRQMRQISSGDGWGGGELVAHFGVGAAERIEEIRIEWPSGISQVISQAPVNQQLRVVESEFAPENALTISPAGVFFTNQVSVVIQKTIPAAEIRFTTDTSIPTLASELYTGPLELQASAIIKARLFLNQEAVSTVVTANYARIYAVDDGIPSSWRQEFFGPGYLTNPRVHAHADPDGDGSDNLQEFLGGTHPMDPLSGFSMNIRLVPEVSWKSVPGVNYRLLKRSTLQPDAPLETVSEVVAESDWTTYLDFDTTLPSRFYLIEAEEPPPVDPEP